MASAAANETGYALAFETSSAFGEIALGCGGDILQTRSFSGPRRHATEFLPTIDALCRDCSVTPDSVRAVYVSAGPGSFTGLRIGVTAARMIALATGARVAAVPTLSVIAQNAAQASPLPEYVAVILDAKRGKVYAASFEHRGLGYVTTCQPVEVDPGSFLERQHGSCAVLGEGVAYHREAVEASGLLVLPESLYPPRAAIVYRLGADLAGRGEFNDPRRLTPIYIRPPEAEENWEQRQERHTSDGPINGLGA